MQLQRLASTTNNLIEAVAQFELLPIEMLTHRVHPASWNALECFEHLNRYARYYHLALKKAISKVAPFAQGSDSYVHTWIGRKFIGMMNPDNTKKQKTLKHLNPLLSPLSIDVIHEYRRHLEDLLLLIEQAHKFDLRKLKIGVEFFPLLKMNGADTLEFLVAHNQRHVAQALRVVNVDRALVV